MEDFATRLTPIWRDQKQVSVDMARLLPNAGMDITRLQDRLASGTVFGAVPDRLQSEASSGVPILVMGDLGVLGASPAASLDLWMTFAQERKAEGRRCIALTPAPLSAYPEPVREKLWSLVPWEEKPQRAIAEPGRANQADRLLGLLSHHMKIPPGLLRDVRRLYPEMSAVTEIQAWRSPHLVSPHPIAATLSNAAKEQLRGHFRAEPLERKQQIYRLIRKWCGGDYDSVYFEAVLSLGALAADVVGPADMAAAVECIRDMAGIVDCASAPVRLRGVGKPQVERYFREMRGRIGDAPKEITAASEAFDRLSAAVAPGKSDDAYPTGFDPAVLGAPGPQRKLTLRQRGGQLVAMPPRQAGLFEAAAWPADDDAESSFFADIVTARDDLAVWENPFWKTGAPPNWTSDYGTDEIGPWVEFAVIDADGAMIRQRMRWIGPGRFRMGSPEDEPGRYDNEGPRHEVRISEGFWLFDTPVTQALWEAVMGGNPSRFADRKRPVEQVSWDEASEFLQKINSRIPGLELVLPTEAQWEYACRAGTETATYVGPIDILGDNNAPILDAIAWYGGNSGVGFELENGYDSSDWPGKQYDHSRAGTHPVGQKLPNGWGLYDMLGNVWEWCADDLRSYGKLKVFISYSRRDFAAADALAEALHARGFNVITDRRDLPFGENWQAELAKFIDLSDAVVWLVSEASVHSKSVSWELNEVARRSKRLVPVQVGETPLDRLPRQLGEIHILSGGQGLFDLSRDLETLVQVLETDLARLGKTSLAAPSARSAAALGQQCAQRARCPPLRGRPRLPVQRHRFPVRPSSGRGGAGRDGVRPSGATAGARSAWRSEAAVLGGWSGRAFHRAAEAARLCRPQRLRNPHL